MGLKIKKISPKQFGNAIAGAGKAVGKSVVSAGKGVASAGKALGKCKPGDVKCAAKGMANLYLSTVKVVVAASPAGAAYVASDKISGGKIGKGVSAASKSVLGVDPKDLASGDINKMGKAVGKALYKVSGAETVVTSGKALAKCKPKDAACIAKGMAQIGSVALMYIPGAGGAAAVAMKVAQSAVKGAVQKEVEAVARKKLAQEKEKRAKAKLAAATNDEERRRAQAEAEAARSDVSQADDQLRKVENEKVAAEKQLQQSATVVASQTAAKAAYDMQADLSAKNPEIAAQVNAELKPGNAAAQADAAAATSAAGTKAVLASQLEIAKGLEKLGEEPKYFGIPQSKLLMGGLAFLFFLLTILILKP
jgi:hypothetical protein